MAWIECLIDRVSSGEDLSVSEMSEAIDAIMRGECSENQIGRLLLALRAKGECVAEVAGAAQALRKHMTRIRTWRTGAIDTCGTGGDGSAMFNVSTAAAIVAAAAGATVAKHGNRRVSSTSGSADVLKVLGVNIEATVGQVEACLDALGICFCFAPLMHPSMRHVAEVRRQLGVPTIFNLLGPLCNPAEVRIQLLGVGKPHLRPLLAEALVLLGTERAVVVCGEDGVDEVTLAGRTWATEAGPSGSREFCWSPEDFGLSRSHTASMRVNGPEESAAVIRQVLEGQRGLPRDIVVLNAAAALWTAGIEPTPTLCARRAEQAIDTGQAHVLLARLAQLSAA